ncbi:hypothetical protein D1839_05825 [Roseburia sp. 1XD42-34]|nr:hypothetical protein [Roseburia sp. 1XD42-34]RKI79893.1 hypothetical protein D7V87_05815 [Clostridium sp. 1xD42-85]
MPLKQGYADAWATSPFLAGVPLTGEPMMPYRRVHFYSRIVAGLMRRTWDFDYFVIPKHLI